MNQGTDSSWQIVCLKTKLIRNRRNKRKPYFRALN